MHVCVHCVCVCVSSSPYSLDIHTRVHTHTHTHTIDPDMMDKLDQEEVAQAKDENDLDLVPPKDENDPVMIFPDLVDGLSKSDWGRPNDDSLDKDDDWANLPDNNNNDVNLKPVKAGGDKKPEVFQPPVIGQSAPDKPSSSGGGGWFGMWHFLIIFLLIAGVVGVVYVCSHNRKRVSVCVCARTCSHVCMCVCVCVH